MFRNLKILGLLLLLLILVLMLFIKGYQKSSKKNLESAKNRTATFTSPNFTSMTNQNLQPSGAPIKATPSLMTKVNNVSIFVALKPEEIVAAQLEMKISLVSQYAAQKSFYSEYQRYSTDFKAIGYMPAETERWSKTGYLTPALTATPIPNEDPRNLNTDAYMEETHIASEQIKYRPSASLVNLGDLNRYCAQGCTATAQTFEAIAATKFREDLPPDVWTINDKKEIVHVHDGLSK